MRTLKESIEINISAEKIWEWLLKFADNYCEWHPNHIKAYWKNGVPNEIGSIMYAEEIVIPGEVLKMTSKLTKLIPNKMYEFKTLKSLGMLMPKGSFQIEPKERGCIFTATLDFRMGNFLNKFAKKSVGFIQNHMKEEGQNLKKILES